MERSAPSPVTLAAKASLGLLAGTYALLSCWRLCEYSHNFGSYRWVHFAFNEPFGKRQSSIVLATSAAAVVIVVAITTRPKTSWMTRCLLLLSIPVVSWLTALAGHADHAEFLLFHIYQAGFMLLILSWPVLLGVLAADSGHHNPGRSSQSHRRPWMPGIACLLLVFFVTTVSLEDIAAVMFETTQIGASAAGPVLRTKFNLWLLVIGNAVAINGCLCVWASRSFDRWTPLRLIATLLSSIFLASSLHDAFRTTRVFWPIIHNYDPAFFVGKRPGYIVWFVLTSIIAGCGLVLCRRLFTMDRVQDD